MARPKNMQEFKAIFTKEFGISQSFQEASNHSGHCRCEKCLDWWIQMGVDEDDHFGPFSAEEIAEAKRKK